ncbi:hypothetical protein [Mastigocladopsis repens]|uniref:hypothetical protein n=1 Tax=Mastigocladopsis repens TaxID=221287 RepID=UPI0002E00514|nr:hypothetical protein [Mastigocladopsis repens]
MYKSKITYLLFTLTLVIILSWSSISKLPDVLTCQQSNVFRATGERYYTHPQKVVVEPWRGEHHVYAIFMIPGGHLNDKLYTVTIEGVGTFCGELAFAGTTVAYGVSAKPGHYLMKALFKTRAAVWLIAQGKGDELKQPRHWRVGYAKIAE